MIENYYNFCHNTLGIEMYTIPLLIAAAVACVIGLVHWHKQNKRQDEFEESCREE